MKIIKFIKFKVAVMLVIFLMTTIHESNVRAQALAAPLATLTVNRAVGALLTAAVISRGYSVNDPKFQTTLSSVSNRATALNVFATAAGVGLGIAGAPIWLGIAASVGIFAVGTAIIAGTASLELQQGKVTVNPGTASVSSYTAPLFATQPTLTSDAWGYAASLGSPVYRNANCLSSDAACMSYPALSPNVIANFTWAVGSVSFVSQNIEQLTTFLNRIYRPNVTGETRTYSFNFVPSSTGTSFLLTSTIQGVELCNTCTGSTYVFTPYTRSQDTSFIAVGLAAYPRSASDINTLYPSIPSSVLNQPLTATTLAQLTDRLWASAAAQPAYAGIPYAATRPITAVEAQAILDAGVASTPTLGDLLSPASMTSATPVVISPTATTAVTSPTTSTVQDVNVTNVTNVTVNNKVAVDLGADPGIGLPTVEATPTANSILAPIFALFADVKAYAVPAHTSVCPQPSFDAFHKTFTMTSHCTLLEGQRTTIYWVMGVVYLLSALLIVLTA
jgi:hypothetical protein